MPAQRGKGTRQGRFASKTRIHLSPQQRRILACRQAGLSYKETAEVLGRSINTVKFHLHVIFEKTGARSSAEAILLAA